MSREERDEVLKRELSPEKVNVIDKFGLKSTPDLYWIQEKENIHTRVVFKHSFLKKSDLIGVLFRIYGLCFAKLNYFRDKIDDFEPCIYDFKNGFKSTDLWDVDFFKHKASNYYIDIRQLLGITDIKDFYELCEYLESFENNSK